VRHAVPIAAMSIFFAACSDVPRDGARTTPTAPRSVAIASDDSSGVPKLVLREEVATKTFAVVSPQSPEHAQLRARRAPASPEMRAALEARSKAAAALPAPLGAIADGDLPDGALAWVVRPAGRAAPTLLFAHSAFSMRAWNAAHAAMMADEFSHLEPAQERLLVVEAVDRWRNPEGEVRSISVLEPQGAAARQSAQEHEMKIRRGLEGGRPAVVRGIAARIRNLAR